MLESAQSYIILLFYLLGIVWLECSKGYSRYKNIFLLISTLIIILFIGTRWETGTDWDGYKNLFDTLKLDWTFFLNVYHFELGYVLFNALVKLFTNNYTLFLLINAGLTIGLLSILIKKVSYYPNVSILLFYSNFVIAQFMGSNRRMMAMVFVLWMFYFFSINKYKKGYIWLLFAVLFHKSSIITFFAKFIPKKAFSIKSTIYLLMISLIIGVTGIPQLLLDKLLSIFSSVSGFEILNQITMYSDNAEEHMQNGTGSLLISSILAVGKRGIFLAFYSYLIKKNKVDKITSYFYNIYIVSFSGYLVLVGTFFQMLTSFFTFIEVLLIGRLFIYTNARMKLIFCSLIGLFALMQIANALNVYPDLYLPYKSILWL